MAIRVLICFLPFCACSCWIVLLKIGTNNRRAPDYPLEYSWNWGLRSSMAWLWKCYIGPKLTSNACYHSMLFGHLDLHSSVHYCNWYHYQLDYINTCIFVDQYFFSISYIMSVRQWKQPNVELWASSTYQLEVIMARSLCVWVLCSEPGYSVYLAWRHVTSQFLFSVCW